MFIKYFAFTNILDIFHIVKRSLKFAAWMGRVYILFFFYAKLELKDPCNQRYRPDNDRGFPLI